MAEEKVFNLLRKCLKGHSAKLDSNNPKDYLDMYLSLSPDEKVDESFSGKN